MAVPRRAAFEASRGELSENVSSCSGIILVSEGATAPNQMRHKTDAKRVRTQKEEALSLALVRTPNLSAHSSQRRMKMTALRKDLAQTAHQIGGGVRHVGAHLQSIGEGAGPRREHLRVVVDSVEVARSPIVRGLRGGGERESERESKACDHRTKSTPSQRRTKIPRPRPNVSPPSSTQ